MTSRRGVRVRLHLYRNALGNDTPNIKEQDVVGKAQTQYHTMLGQQLRYPREGAADIDAPLQAMRQASQVRAARPAGLRHSKFSSVS
jgi:hypothetical protein